MKVAFFTHWYDPEGGSAATSGIIARALVRRGIEVHAITGYPIYPAGKIFDGYKNRPYQREVIDGVTVHRGPIYPSHDTRALHRMANYLSFSASGTAVSLAAARSCDVGLVYSSPATAAIPGMAMRAMAGLPYVMQIQDLWPDTVTHSGFVEEGTSGKMDTILGKFCDSSYRLADQVAVTSPGMATILQSRGVPSDKLSYIPNWADESNFRPEPKSEDVKRELGLTRPFVAMYAGNFGEMQALDTILDAAAALRERTDIEFAMVGAGVVGDHLRERVEREALTNVTFVESQPFSRMSNVLAVGDVQLATLKDIPLYRSTTPSKIQANFAAGRPVIAAISGDAGAIVERAKAGYATPPTDSAALAQAVARMADLSQGERHELGRNARAYYDEHFSEKVVGDQLVELLEKTAADNHASKSDGKRVLSKITKKTR